MTKEEINAFGRKMVKIHYELGNTNRLRHEEIIMKIGYFESLTFENILFNWVGNDCKEFSCDIKELQLFTEANDVKEDLIALKDAGLIKINERGGKTFYDVDFEGWQKLHDEYEKEKGNE